VHVFAAEQLAATHPPTLRERERYKAHHFAHGPRWDLRSEQGERWFGFDGVRAMDSRADILLIPLVGHTRGHCGVAVRTANGWMLHAGDAYFAAGEMQPDDHCPPALRVFQRIVAMNNEQRMANRERLRALVRDHAAEVTVHSAHCPVEYGRHQHDDAV
jgi:glyoxylase-like metal-dependent hydrolase (beta-lactamase superfamily II)